MTEIPEHLLKRSKQRRSALGLGGDEGDAEGGDAAESGSSAAPAKAESAAAPAPVMAAPSPEAQLAVPAKPDPPFVAAAKQRKKVPYWMVPVLAFLPFWALLYANILEVGEAEATGKLALGGEVFASNCASCHGADGGGGVGPQLSGGEVLLTFPDMADQIEFVSAGSVAGEAYGARGAVGSGGMPAFGSSLSEEELAAVICHERVTLSGGDEPECAEGAEGGAGDHGDSGGGDSGGH